MCVSLGTNTNTCDNYVRLIKPRIYLKRCGGLQNGPERYCPLAVTERHVRNMIGIVCCRKMGVKMFGNVGTYTTYNRHGHPQKKMQGGGGHCYPEFDV